jgi:neural Wiskott-Aldrich syndrome protein
MPPLPASATSLGQRAAMPRESSANGLAGSPAQGSALTLIYNGERHPITKDRFVIGRGRQSSDLTLKDPNVSRQHAVVEFQNGVYFMVDMGSTNGVAYNGQRIARKPIDEGDVFRICDHDLQFTYQ